MVPSGCTTLTAANPPVERAVLFTRQICRAWSHCSSVLMRCHSRFAESPPVSANCASARPSSHVSLRLGSPNFFLKRVFFWCSCSFMVAADTIGNCCCGNAHARRYMILALTGLPSTCCSERCQYLISTISLMRSGVHPYGRMWSFLHCRSAWIMPWILRSLSRLSSSA